MPRPNLALCHHGAPSGGPVQSHWSQGLSPNVICPENAEHQLGLQANARLNGCIDAQGSSGWFRPSSDGPQRDRPVLGPRVPSPGFERAVSEPAYFGDDSPCERSSRFDDLLGIIGNQMATQLEQLRAAHLADLGLAGRCELSETRSRLSPRGANTSLGNWKLDFSSSHEPAHPSTLAWPLDAGGQDDLSDASPSERSVPMHVMEPKPSRQLTRNKKVVRSNKVAQNFTAQPSTASEGIGPSSPSGASLKSLLKPGLFAVEGCQGVGNDTEALELEMKVQRMFEEMDQDGNGNVSPHEFLHLLRSYGVDDVSVTDIETAFKDFTRSTRGEELPALNLDSFRDLLSNVALDLDGIMGCTGAARVRQLRLCISKCNMSRMILNAAGLQRGRTIHIKEDNMDLVVDTFVGCIIFLNALTMGIAEDIPWEGWSFVNAVFIFIYTLEIAGKIVKWGSEKFFWGHDFLWNWADIVITIVSIADTIIFSILDSGASPGLRNLMLLRLLRLTRLMRLVKLMRLRIFKELRLMLRGVFFGLRTLCWALILFIVWLYILALVIRLMLTPAQIDAPWCNTDHLYCRRSQEIFGRHYDELFANTPRCIITIMRCFTDGCNSVDGTPLIPTLFNIYGYLLLFPYVFFMFLITFGLFNLITAILVENTVEAAKMDKRGISLRHAEQLRIASKLKNFIERSQIICSEATAGNRFTWRPRWRDLRARDLLPKLRCFGKNPQKLETLMEGMMEFEITPEIFTDLIWDKEISELLDDLDIASANREGLFDVLDADGNGCVSVEELIRGLLKLRGSAEKSDVVGVLLGLRALQKEMRAHLKPMIRLLGALCQDTCHRVHQLEKMINKRMRDTTVI